MLLPAAGMDPQGGHAMREHEVIQLTDAATAAPIENEWRDLASRIEGSSYFQTPDWVLAWWEDAGRPPAEIALWRDASGALEAVVCVTRLRERLVRQLPLMVRITTNLGSGRPHSADHCGWPVLPHRVPEAQHWLATHRWGDALVLRHLDQRTGVPLVPRGARFLLTTACPRMELTGEPGEPVGSPGLRAEVRRWKRKLDALGVSFAWVPPEAMTVAALDTLFTLSDSRRSLKGTSSFIRERSFAFHRALIGRAGPGHGPTMVFALHEGRPIGALYGLVWRDTFCHYQGGWNAAWARLRIGKVLESETIRLAHLHGLRCFDFLRGAEHYKYRFGGVDRMDESWLLPRGFGGWLVSRKYQLLRMQRMLREMRKKEPRDDAEA